MGRGRRGQRSERAWPPAAAADSEVGRTTRVSRQEGKGQMELGAAGSREGQEHTGPTWAPLPL